MAARFPMTRQVERRNATAGIASPSNQLKWENLVKPLGLRRRARMVLPPNQRWLARARSVDGIEAGPTVLASASDENTVHNFGVFPDLVLEAGKHAHEDDVGRLDAFE